MSPSHPASAAIFANAIASAVESAEIAPTARPRP